MKTLLISIAALFLLAISTPPAQAVSGINQLKNNLNIIGVETGLGSQEDANLPQRIAAIVNIALGFLGLLAVIMIIYAGFKWMTAAGNEDQVREARDNIRNAVIGIVIVMLSFVLVNFVVNQLSNTVGSGGGSGGGNTVSGPVSCLYAASEYYQNNFNCDTLCVDSVGPVGCPANRLWEACENQTFPLAEQRSGTCDQACPGCPRP